MKPRYISPALLLAATVFLPATLPAQLLKNFFVPKGNATAPGNVTSNSIPFGKLVHYQQVYGADTILASVGPVRLRGVRFRGSTRGPTQPGFSLDIQVSLGMITAAPSNTFSQNLKRGKIVFSRKTYTLGTNNTTFHLNLPFDTGVEYLWDGTSDLVLDIQIFGNGNGNSAFLYYIDSVVGVPKLRRLYAVGSGAAAVATRNDGTALVTRFDYVDGLVLPFGKGCKGLGGFIPQSTTNIIPVIGSANFRMELRKAPPQQPGLLLWGFSRTKFGPIKLPFDLRSLGMIGCTLLVDPQMIWPITTIGGSPGTGTAAVPLAIPALPPLRGLQFFSQWLILDPSQTQRNPRFTWSNGALMVIG